MQEVIGEVAPVIEEEYSIADIQSWLQRCNKKKVNEISENLSSIVTFKQIEDIYYFRLEDAEKTYILETDLDKNVLRFVSFDMPTYRIKTYRAHKNGREYEYYSAYGEQICSVRGIWN